MLNASYPNNISDSCSISAEDTKLLLISGIPKSYHASNLRNFFSQFVESSKFSCFHYRHRPDIVGIEPTTEIDGTKFLKSIKLVAKSKTTCCAIFSIYGKYIKELFRLYSGLNWPNENDDVPLELKCTLHLLDHATVERK